ncbi:MAG TPA: DUF4388 domain-containing protein [Candidatus Obscuribacterales bacterium]
MEGTAVATDIRCFAGSVGLLIDRTSHREQVLSTVWLLDDNKAATCAHSMLLFTEFLGALKVRFPATGEERGIVSAHFHPKFRRRTTTQMAQQALIDSTPMLPLQKHNAVVLALSHSLPNLPTEVVIEVNRRVTPPAPPRDHGMGGSLSEIDLALVIQTITNARKEGLLILSDERNRTIARIFCQEGKVVHAQLESLINEMALYQIVSMKLDGSFYFCSTPDSNMQGVTAIARPAESLLLEAHRRMDELAKLKERLGGRLGDGDGLWARTDPHIKLNMLAPEVQEAAKALWPLLDGAIPASQLWRIARLDDYAVFSALVELLRTGQIEDRSHESIKFTMKTAALPVGAQTPLSPWDSISSLVVDPSGRPLIKTGSLLGSLRAQDPNHLVHNLALLPESAGSPLFKNGLVIGMHCGGLPPDPGAGAADNSNLQQMLWIDSILQCLTEGSDVELARKLSKTGLEIPKPGESKRPDPGCREVARINCPKCGASSLESARFCKTCGQKLIQEIQYQPKRSEGQARASGGSSWKAALASFAVLITLLGAAVGALMCLPASPNIVPVEYVSVPETPWIKVVAMLAKKPTAEERGGFAELPKSAEAEHGDIMYLKVNPEESGYVYILWKETSSPTAKMLYPITDKDDNAQLGGEEFTCPRVIGEQLADKNVEVNVFALGPPAGVDTCIAISSPTGSTLQSQSTLKKETNVRESPAINSVYEKADAFLSNWPFEGVLVDAKMLGEGIFKDPDKRVYLTRLKIAHH